VLKAYFDESFGQKNTFGFSCVFTDGSTWGKLEKDWVEVIDRKNESLRKAGRQTISRYHAGDCASYHGEYTNWSRENNNAEQIAFFKELLAVLRKYPLNAIGYTLNLDELAQEIPGLEDKQVAFGYAIILQYVMWALGKFVAEKQAVGERITLFHDRAEGYTGVISRAFESMVKKEDFKYTERFVTIAPLAWQDCVCLQPADLIAYENVEETERHMGTGKLRRSLEAILDLPLLGGVLTHLDRSTLKELKSYLEKDDLMMRIIGCYGNEKTKTKTV
jgi:hypothetical protein